MHRFMLSRVPARKKSSSQGSIRVVAAVIRRGNRILVCRRRIGDTFPLKWEFPGGKVKAGESDRAALARELEEEIDVRARIGRRILTTRHKYQEHACHVELAFYVARIGRQRVSNLAFEQIAWVTPKTLLALDFLAADREFVAQLANRKIRL
jgi:8-oxo-dGTP diphosphatase